ncbi:transglycosylase family protein [Streptomyces sp. WMMB303]|uniref:transglycosylase family protein n=1 Tax=Streptomyces sp. WMMB303 TaxID=3034154 RepID=UPI0023EADD70|nr:transglycosylase family protein [Streptomyces sp. WMMB303]MDF4251087.1 transglycosylase family protein [Streptomyces sp. WMMB303]
MRSGNGRHRRPRQAPALFVAAGVTGAGIALPLLGATGAHAADAQPWDRVADCESGGAWSANDSNGYYGGLQLDLDTWKYYGGTMYAERPDLATRSQQIAVGEKILQSEGPRAFPQCGGDLKLEIPGSDEDADPSGKPPQNPADSAGKSDPSGKPDDAGKSGAPDAQHPETDPSPDASESPTDNDGKGDKGHKDTDDGGADEGADSDRGSGEPESGESGTPQPPSDESTSDAPGSGASEPGSPDTDTGSDSAGDTSGWSDLGPSSPNRLKSPSDSDRSGKGRHRGRPAEERPEHDERGERSSRGGDRDRTDESGGRHRITVRAGDSLARIAAEQDVEGGWSELYAQNRETVGDDPDLIRPGQHLTL